MKKYLYTSILSICLLTNNSFAQEPDNNEDKHFRFDGAFSVGVLVAGDRHPTGGFDLSPNLLIGFKIPDSAFGLSYQNTLNLTSFHSIKGLGILDSNSALLSIFPTNKMAFDLGPSLDIVSMIFCDNGDVCYRQTGTTWGIHLKYSLYERMLQRGLGIQANVHFTWIPINKLPIFTTTIGPSYQL